MTKLYVTANKQKDGRIVLGTAVHNDPECSTLKRRNVVEIERGQLCNMLPKCDWCLGRAKRNLP